MNIRKRALMVLIAVFILGCLAGATGYRIWGDRDRWRQGLSVASSEMDRMPRLEQLLQLTPAQQVQIKEIYENLRRQIDAHQAETDRSYEALRHETNGKIAAILNDEQKKKFEQYVKDATGRRESSRRRRAAGAHTPQH